MSQAGTRLRITALVMIAPIGTLAFTARRAAARLSSQAALDAIIEAPSEWVPFQADVTVTKTQEPPVVGRFYRASDGSTRLETGPSKDDVRVISILNVAEANRYLYSQQRGWKVQPVANGTPGKYSVPRWRKGLAGWSQYPYRLALRRGESGSLNAQEGFSAYQVTQQEGVYHLKVPELNLFDVVTRLANGRVETYANIEIVEPPASLFRPPAGAAVAKAVPIVPQG